MAGRPRGSRETKKDVARRTKKAAALNKGLKQPRVVPEPGGGFTGGPLPPPPTGGGGFGGGIPIAPVGSGFTGGTPGPTGGGGFGGGIPFPPAGGNGGGGFNPCLDVFGRNICLDDVTGFFGGGADPNNSPGAAASCPPGFEVDPSSGRCIASGTRGTIERMLPGGETGVLGDQFGPAVVGGFGIPGIIPAQVGTRRRANGTVGPILMCPRGAVLGKDDVCYQKGSIPASFRKWRPAPKPPMSAADAKALRRIKTLQGKAKRLATASGLTCRSRR